MLEVTDIEAGYGAVRIVHGVSLSVPAGVVVGVLGCNGTGKSTLLKCVAGLIAPSAGSIRFDGHDLTGTPAHRLPERGLVLVPQGKDAFGEMTVAENLRMGGYVRRRDRAGLAQDMERALDLLPKLRARYRTPAAALSGGERQMLAIARALVARPRMLLLDEPSAALAPVVVQEIEAILRRLAGDGLTILLVEQNVGLALALCQRVVILRGGRVAHETAVDASVDYAALRSFYLGATTMGAGSAA